MGWSDSPIVTFSRGGDDFVLGRGPEDAVLHLRGSTGLGLAPVSIASTERLAGDGNVVRGVRRDAREVYIPLMMEAPSAGELSRMRRDLNRVLAPVTGDPEASLVDVRIDDPATGTVRTARGIYKDGLSGDFGDEFHGVWQTLGLTFECPDPWWLGPEQTSTLRLNPGSKPFLSDTEPFFPILLAESVVLGEWSITVEGDAEVWPTWEITGPGEDLLIESAQGRIFIDGEFRAGQVTRIDTRNGRIVPDRWDDVSLDSVLFPLLPGVNRVKVSQVGATADSSISVVWRERYLEGV